MNIAQLGVALRGGEVDARYLAYFECFNRQLFFEAHNVLETLWSNDRTGPNGDFYKGLIQLAGAFVHLQKNRAGPAGTLLRSASANLTKYPPVHLRSDLTAVLDLIASWSHFLESAPKEVARLVTENPPALTLLRAATCRK